MHLKRLTKLSTLNRANHNVTGFGLRSLQPKIRREYLQSGQVTAAGLADLQKALSNCRVKN